VRLYIDVSNNLQDVRVFGNDLRTCNDVKLVDKTKTLNPS